MSLENTHYIGSSMTKESHHSALAARRTLAIFSTIVCLILYLGGIATPAAGQSIDDDEQSDQATQAEPNDEAPDLVEPRVYRWKMGLQLKGGPGQAIGIRATCPLPVEWPEQQIKVIEQTKSDNVKSVKIEDLDNSVQQMMVAIAELGSGETAEVIVELEITKAWIGAPANTQQLQFAKRMDRHVKKYLAPSPFIESRDRRIKEIAKELEEQTANLTPWQQVEAIYDWVREKVEYRFDEQIKSSLDALDDGHGDCEELSSLFIAICRARGVPARAVWIPGHTYPEFYLVDSEGNGHWYPCQAAGAREFGAMSESRPILQKGDRFKIHGHREMMRYVQPTLTAKDATASPSVKWILEEVKETIDKEPTDD